ncbi:hypothetical protein NLG97_g6615 [Lecanicillium saksenae]|uniref:Uncharacterized protein n=1 Tax=Lecanicillium saksenae TaxID=468837 RepID=A0ACC1QQT2_9HYPO|nr:hypothetical protein NLG97_g6615 [Lecanicillium saksenae]
MLFSNCHSDASIGPSVSGCRDEFDFTMKFENVAFAIAPSATFIVLSAFRLLQLYRKPVVVHSRRALAAKMFTSLANLLLHVCFLVLVAHSTRATSTLVGAAVCQLIAAIGMAALSHLEHGRSPRPSILLTGYLLFTTVLDVARARTFWLASISQRETAIAAAFTSLVAIKVCYFATECIQKEKWVQWENKERHSPEEVSGLGLGVYAWVNSLFLQGYRTILSLDNLFPLDTAMKSQVLYSRFSQHIDGKALTKDKHALLKALARTLAMSLLLTVPPRLCVTGFTYSQPFFINALLAFLSGDPEQTPNNYGYGLIGSSILIYGGMALSMAVYLYLRTRTIQMIRGCLISALYIKSTQIPQVGQEPEALTLMSTDIERIRFGLRSMHNLWASPIEVALASWLLYRQLGPAFLAPVVVVAFCAAAIALAVRQIGDAQRKWMGAVQKRTGLTSALVSRMKALKMSGLVEPLVGAVQKLRVDELAAGNRFRGLLVLTAVVGFVPLLLSPVFTFAVTKRDLDSTKIFTSLSYMVLLANPLSQLFQDIPQIFSAIACIGRIQRFLASEPRNDYRFSSRSIMESRSDSKCVPSQGIKVQNGSFGWEEGSMVLKNVNVDIRPGSFTIVCGPTASGKSTLCRALLAELPFFSGEVSMDDKSASVAFCDQEPVLFNDTLKSNVLGSHFPDEERYNQVLQATLLHSDIQSDALPLGDQTVIGSNAIVLSGGQKKRLALARALFAATGAVILDDVFSGLDNKTAKQLFKNVFARDGLLMRRGCTIVLCSNTASHFPDADFIVALGTDGTVAEQGRFQELMQQREGYIRSCCTNMGELDVAEIDQDIVSETTHPAKVPSKPLNPGPETSRNDFDRRKGHRGAYKHYFSSVGYALTFSIVAWGAAIGFSQNFPTIWLTYWGHDLSLPVPTHSSSYYVGIYTLLNVGCILCLIGLGITVFRVAVTKAGARLHSTALHTLRRAQLSFLTETDEGTVVNLFSQDINLIDTELPASLLNSVMAVCMAIGQAAVLVTTSPYLAISYPFLVGFLWVIQHFYLRTSRQLRLLDLETKSPLYAHFTDISKSIVTIRAFGLVDQHLDKGLQLLDDSQRPAYLLAIVQNWLIMVLDFVTMAIAAMLTALAVSLRSNTGFTGASLVTLMSFGDQLTQIVIFLTLLETSLGAITRLQEFSDTVTPEDKPTETVTPAHSWPQHSEIHLRNVSATYSAPAIALREINLTIANGEKIAICGRTGSGKSSFISLLLKFLEPLPTPA